MNIHYSRPIGWLPMLSLVMSVLISACASNSKVHVDQDSHASFANYHSFGWVEPKLAETDAAPALSLAEQRVRASLGMALQTKGYTVDQVHPDVRISYIVDVHERPKQSGMSVGLGAGGGSGNVGGGLGVSLPLGKRHETVAAMTVNVIDAVRNEQVWVGASEVVLKGHEASDADVQALINEIMVKYPASGK